MRKIVECVPNISEGRDEKIINACADAVRKVSGATLLDVDPGKSTNRTVFTFVGDPDSIVEAAFQFSKTAYELIDMTKHRGEHPRMGAVDVVPFVPVAGVTTEDCVDCSKKYGKRVGEELGVPVYLYEAASDNPMRKMLRQIRAGEYEGIKNKIYKPEWKPDFGPQEFVPKSGATVTGSRFFLIAYNVNILGTKEQAHKIALNIREQGRGNGEPGRLKAIKAIGWYVDEYRMAQVSINLDNYTITPPHAVFEECVKDAKEMDLAVCGSELVGLIPLEAMLMAAEYYIKKENLFILDEKQKIRLVVERLGLSSVSQFIPEKRIIEYMIEEGGNEPLASLSVRKFVELVGARTSAPGGGSVSALAASLGAALGAMMGWMSYGNKKFEHLDKKMRKFIAPLDNAMKQLIPMIDADTNAFNDYMNAMRLPKNSDEEKKTRKAKMQEGLKKAIDVPLTVMRIADSCWQWMAELAKYGNLNSSSDLAVGAKNLETGIWGAFKNVEINLPQIEDAGYKEKILNEAKELVDKASRYVRKVNGILEKRKAEGK
ncbi:MAG: glutamate formimidoyltransferase [Ignavibacteria bacterium]|jgi:glutamate formiminotransferase/formiminotetrahydrofolate cyclodeaminase